MSVHRYLPFSAPPRCWRGSYTKKLSARAMVRFENLDYKRRCARYLTLVWGLIRLDTLEAQGGHAGYTRHAEAVLKSLLFTIRREV